jgi:starch synthase
MRILLASSEVHPYSKTGGLADMVGALAKALARMGHETAVATPLYQGISRRFSPLDQTEFDLDLPLGPGQVQGKILQLQPEKNLTIYFVDQPEFFNRPSLYHNRGVDFPDNAARFLFFSKAVVRLARLLMPDVIHAHDWQTGFVPLLTLHSRQKEGWENAPRACFTIHNMAYQGIFPATLYPLSNLPWDYFTPRVEFYGQMSCLKAGIATGDLLTTVSPRYAREITTPEFGCGLDGLLRHRQSALVGILNGVDYEEWNTTRNPLVNPPYSADELEGKTANKLALQKELGLPVDAKVPLFGSITRLVDQKGIDIMLGALEEMLPSELQFVLLSSADNPVFEKAFQELVARYPKQVAIKLGFDQPLSHRIEAGVDFCVMPSRFEPCGLNQRYSLRYGAIPIVRATGGLDDTVVDAAEEASAADGIKFMEYSSQALAKAIRKALVLFREPELLRQFRLNAMRADFSWERTGGEYVKLYERLRGTSPA